MMKEASEFDNILDECLERIIRGESVAACLESYPVHAAELEPLLRTAVDTRQAVAITPDNEFRERASRQFQGAVREITARESRGFFGWLPRWAAVVSVIVIVLLAGSGIVAASGSSLPDSPLYVVKLATETVRLGFTASALDKAELYVKFTDERVNEIIQMADRGKLAQVEQATGRLSDQLTAMADLAVTASGTSGEEKAAVLQAPRAQMEEAPPVEPAPSAAPAPEPAPAEVPAPTAALPPEETLDEDMKIMAAEASGENGESPADSYAWMIEGLEGPEKLKVMVALRATENTQALQEILEQVPESIRPALREAIDIAVSGYEQVLDSLE